MADAAEAAALIGRAVSAIDESGAPGGDRHVLLWNPPVVNPDLGLRASARSSFSTCTTAATS